MAGKRQLPEPVAAADLDATAETGSLSAVTGPREALRRRARRLLPQGQEGSPGAGCHPLGMAGPARTGHCRHQ